MKFLYILESIRFPAMDECMLLITRLGEETAFLVAALIVFWCMDKKKGYYLMSVGFIGTIMNQFFKLLFALPRPWVLDPDFTIVEAAREAATGYSFPSGHATFSVGTFGCLAMMTERRWLRYIWIAIAVLVPFSRMYLGVHTPEDVITGAALALLFVFALKRMAWVDKEQGMKDIIGMMLVMAVCLLLYVEFWPHPADMDAVNLQSGLKNACTMLGCLAGLAVVYEGEKRFVNFETKAVWWAQILKCSLGFAVVLLIKGGLRSPLEMILPVYPARTVRYFLVVVAAGLLWPMTFRYFAKLGVKNELRNH